ncbi:pyruvate, phosphate dikinase [Mycoplasmatota bacterium]|nr:pyruvate, phosphate dikinase [Mycoplasmatota bacterium]
MSKFVYFVTEGKKEMKSLLGGKGANLAEMYNIGLPVPETFTVTTEACLKFYDDDKVIADEIKEEIFENLKKLEEVSGKTFGDLENPLLLSIRSGAVVSLPGMMDTVLNLGLNDATAEAFSAKTGKPVFVYELYRRFIEMFSDVVLGISRHAFDALVEEVKSSKGYKDTNEFKLDDQLSTIEKFKAIVKKERGIDFPQDPKEQLLLAVEAVFSSWNNDRAITYRNLQGIPHSLGTAVNVQMMVFGNTNDQSGTGVAFTRNPSNGNKEIYGEYLINAQGEDIVAGIRTPQHISELQQAMPEIYNQFTDICETLEKHYQDMQDVEFTIEDGKLYMLQTRNGKRTASAAIKIAADFVNEGLSNKEKALMSIDVNYIEKLLHPTFDTAELASATPIGAALPASPGAATGKICLTSQKVVELEKAGEKGLLVRVETSPEDIEGMAASAGILTAVGGATSHAAVVARGMGICCISGMGELRIDEVNSTITIGDQTYNEGDYLSLDGETGKVYAGQIKTQEAEITDDFARVIEWSEEIKNLSIYANADTPKDFQKAIELGAKGIGLCRTEHMFFEGDKITSVRKMILAANKEQREAALSELLPYQYEDFKNIFTVAPDYKISIRLLDPPLHEFLPHSKEDIEVLAKNMGVTYEVLAQKVQELKEFNPMLGHRGCRLAITYPEIYLMQTEAIVSAACDANAKAAEIMVPLIGEAKEYEYLKELIDTKMEEVFSAKGKRVPIKVGTMIEIPRACFVAGDIAKNADFFSYGTNDLTQMTFGFSRDDATKFLGEYQDKQLLEADPFKTVDVPAVGSLVQMAAEKGRVTNPELIRGVCGEHGGDPKSITYFDSIDLDYVSCSPFRVPVAIVAAAQAVIVNSK